MTLDPTLIATIFAILALIAGAYAFLRSTSSQKSGALNRELIADQERLITFQTAERIRLQAENDQLRSKLMERVAVEELRQTVEKHEVSQKERDEALRSLLGKREEILLQFIDETRRRGGGQ